MDTFEVAGVIYDRKTLSAHRESIIELRDGALEQGVMEWAVTLSHTIGILSHIGTLLPEVIGQPVDPKKD